VLCSWRWQRLKKHHEIPGLGSCLIQPIPTDFILGIIPMKLQDATTFTRLTFIGVKVLKYHET
jgi:hypothetical protein